MARADASIPDLARVHTLCRYYDLPFCQPVSPDKESENLGEVLAGDRIESSDYELIMGKNEYCKVTVHNRAGEGLLFYRLLFL